MKIEYISPFPNTPLLLVPNHLNHLDRFLILSEIPADPWPQQVENVLNSVQRSLMEMLPTNYYEPPGLKLFCRFLNHMFW